jgi:hypothetical protein
MAALLELGCHRKDTNMGSPQQSTSMDHTLTQQKLLPGRIQHQLGPVDHHKELMQLQQLHYIQQ